MNSYHLTCIETDILGSGNKDIVGTYIFEIVSHFDQHRLIPMQLGNLSVLTILADFTSLNYCFTDPDLPTLIFILV